MAACALLGGDGAGDGEHLSALLGSGSRRNESTGLLRRFHHQRRHTKTAHNAVTMGKMPASRLHLRRILGKKHACGRHILVESAIFLRIHHVHTAAQHAAGKAAEPQRTLHGGSVNAPRHAGDDHAALLGDLIAQLLSAADTVRSTASCAHHRNGSLLVKERHLALAVEEQRRVIDVLQALGEEGIGIGHHEDFLLAALLQDPLRLIEGAVLQRRQFFLLHVLHQRKVTLVGEVNLLR